MKRFATLLICLAAASLFAADTAKPMITQTNQTELATFGGGCFWCMEAVFERLPGVKAATSGYAGGHTEKPTYEQVCTHTTGHAEVIQVEYDPGKVSYEQLLDLFWEAHDPTTLNRQGHDVGDQYRSIILYHNDAQKQAAEKSKSAAASHFSNPIVTQIEPLKKFFKAEISHQDYYRLNPNAGYCRAIIKPKLDKIEQKHKAEAKP
jgi:peptide-methionine (S)-S-oxide reductase